MNQAARLILFLVASVFFELQSFAADKVEVFSIVNKERTAFSGSSRMSWMWVENEEKVKTLVADVIIDSSQLTKYRSVKTGNQSLGAKLSGSILNVKLGNLAERVALVGDSEKLVLEIRIALDEEPLVDDGCRSNDLIFSTASKRVPFYVGVHCTVVGSNLGLSISLPRNADFGDSNLFESKGKGEPWRYYEVRGLTSAKPEVGNFVFLYKEKKYRFDLSYKKVDTTQLVKEEKPILLTPGLGLTMPAIKGADLDASNSGPGMLIRVPHYKLAGGFGIGFEGEFAVALSSGPNKISFLQLDTAASYEWNLSKTILVRPKVGFLMVNQTHDETQIGISAGELNTGLNIQFAFSPTMNAFVQVSKAGWGSAAIKSHMGIDVGLFFKKSESMGYGAMFRMQSFSTLSELGIERTFSRNGFYLFVVI